jgi:hypothetical protein
MLKWYAEGVYGNIIILNLLGSQYRKRAKKDTLKYMDTFTLSETN